MPGHVKKGGKQEQDPGNLTHPLCGLREICYFQSHTGQMSKICDISSPPNLRIEKFGIFHFLSLLLCIISSNCSSLLDPSPWLVLSFEMKKEDSLKPYGEIIGFLEFVINLSFQTQRNRSGSLMERVALTRP